MKKIDPIDTILALYKKYMPETVYLLKNPDRYPDTMKAVKELSDFVLSIDENAKITATPDDLIGDALCVEITTDLIVVSEIDKLCSLLSKADTLEVNPLTNGKIEVALSFEKVWIPAPPAKKNNLKD